VNRAISTRGTVREALQVVEEMKAAGLSANEGTFAALVTVCRRQKQGERALVVYDVSGGCIAPFLFVIMWFLLYDGAPLQLAPIFSLW
jgi:hypothetical protein